MFCPSCGVATQSGQRFCNACGAALAAEAPVSRSPLPPPPVPRPDADTIAVPAGQIPPAAASPRTDVFATADVGNTFESQIGVRLAYRGMPIGLATDTQWRTLERGSALEIGRTLAARESAAALKKAVATTKN